MKDIAAIVYTSNTGFTMQYAQLLGQAAAIPVYDLEDGLSAPAPGARVLYLGWLSAGKIKGLSKARRRWKVKAVCAVGMAPEGQNTVERLTEQNRLEDIPAFYLRGGYAPERLTGIYKIMMSAMAKMVSRAPAESEEDKAMRDSFAAGGDWVDMRYLDPVLAWLREQDGP